MKQVAMRTERGSAPISAPTPVLVVDRFSKSYGGKKVVEGVSLSVDSGSIFGFVGR